MFYTLISGLGLTIESKRAYDAYHQSKAPRRLKAIRLLFSLSSFIHWGYLLLFIILNFGDKAVAELLNISLITKTILQQLPLFFLLSITIHQLSLLAFRLWKTWITNLPLRNKLNDSLLQCLKVVFILGTFYSAVFFSFPIFLLLANGFIASAFILPQLTKLILTVYENKYLLHKKVDLEYVIAQGYLFSMALTFSILGATQVIHFGSPLFDSLICFIASFYMGGRTFYELINEGLSIKTGVQLIIFGLQVSLGVLFLSANIVLPGGPLATMALMTGIKLLSLYPALKTILSHEREQIKIKKHAQQSLNNMSEYTPEPSYFSAQYKALVQAKTKILQDETLVQSDKHIICKNNTTSSINKDFDISYEVDNSPKASTNVSLG
jgi:hypothetical protein